MALVSIEQVWPAPQCPTAGKINNIASFPRRLKSLLIKQSPDGARTQSLVPLLPFQALPACSQALPACSQALPACSQALPACSQALPACSQALPGNKYLEAL